MAESEVSFIELIDGAGTQTPRGFQDCSIRPLILVSGAAWQLDLSRAPR